MSHKCFISYHAADKKAVDDFCDKFSGGFIRRGVNMEEDIIDSNDTDYVMRRIRELYLQILLSPLEKQGCQAYTVDKKETCLTDV